MFFDYDSKELSLEQINQRLSEDGKLEIKTCLEKTHLKMKILFCLI